MRWRGCWPRRAARFGPITALVHGAGRIADKLIADKTDAQFDLVHETKVGGLRALLAATAADPLRLIALFASVAGRRGNPGQCDYAAANETLVAAGALRGPAARRRLRRARAGLGSLGRRDGHARPARALSGTRRRPDPDRRRGRAVRRGGAAGRAGFPRDPRRGGFGRRRDGEPAARARGDGDRRLAPIPHRPCHRRRPGAARGDGARMVRARRTGGAAGPGTDGLQGRARAEGRAPLPLRQWRRSLHRGLPRGRGRAARAGAARRRRHAALHRRGGVCRNTARRRRSARPGRSAALPARDLWGGTFPRPAVPGDSLRRRGLAGGGGRAARRRARLRLARVLGHRRGGPRRRVAAGAALERSRHRRALAADRGRGLSRLSRALGCGRAALHAARLGAGRRPGSLRHLLRDAGGDLVAELRRVELHRRPALLATPPRRELSPDRDRRSGLRAARRAESRRALGSRARGCRSRLPRPAGPVAPAARVGLRRRASPARTPPGRIAAATSKASMRCSTPRGSRCRRSRSTGSIRWRAGCCTFRGRRCARPGSKAGRAWPRSSAISPFRRRRLPGSPNGPGWVPCSPTLPGSARSTARDRFMSGLPAHLVARALGLGPAFALDAACASSLYAIKLACDLLHDRRADVALAGAVNAADDLFIHVGFTALQALSRSGRSRPFHREADGLLPAEGAGAVALKRLEDAQAAGDRIFGVIRGIGLSNDGRGRGLLAPERGGTGARDAGGLRRGGAAPGRHLAARVPRDRDGGRGRRRGAQRGACFRRARRTCPSARSNRTSATPSPPRGSPACSRSSARWPPACGRPRSTPTTR